MHFNVTCELLDPLFLGRRLDGAGIIVRAHPAYGPVRRNACQDRHASKNGAPPKVQRISPAAPCQLSPEVNVVRDVPHYVGIIRSPVRATALPDAGSPPLHMFDAPAKKSAPSSRYRLRTLQPID